MIIPLAKLHAAEPDRWPGYAAWAVAYVCANGGRVDCGNLVLSPLLHGRLADEVARRRPGIPPRQVLTPVKVAHGVVGLVKAITGTGGATAETVAARVAVCNACPNASWIAGMLIQCRLCGCSTWAKVRNAGETCPIGKWERYIQDVPNAR